MVQIQTVNTWRARAHTRKLAHVRMCACVRACVDKVFDRVRINLVVKRHVQFVHFNRSAGQHVIITNTKIHEIF